MRKKVTRVVISGVGGQGVMLLSRIIMHAARLCNLATTGSEIHGHAVRGGPTYSIITYGSNHESPLLLKNSADYLIGLELLETIRMGSFLREGGYVITSNIKIPPVNSILKNEPYPSEDYLRETFRNWAKEVIIVNTKDILSQFGTHRVLNSVLYGVFAALEQETIPIEVFKDALLTNVPAKYKDENLKAFEKGIEVATQIVPIL